jgi:hypothetical protein
MIKQENKFLFKQKVPILNDFQAPGEAFSPSERTSSTSKQKILIFVQKLNLKGSRQEFWVSYARVGRVEGIC